MTKNPLTVTHDDMLQQARRRLQYMEKAYPVKVTQQEMTSWSATHQIEVQKSIVRLIEKTKPVKQTKLF